MENSLQVYNRQQKLSMWADRVTACRESGMTVRQWCEENGISVKTYYNWQKRLYQMATEQEPRFAEITGCIPQSRSSVATVQIGAAQAEIHVGADEETLRSLFQAMKSC